MLQTCCVVSAVIMCCIVSAWVWRRAGIARMSMCIVCFTHRRVAVEVGSIGLACRVMGKRVARVGFFLQRAWKWALRAWSLGVSRCQYCILNNFLCAFSKFGVRDWGYMPAYSMSVIPVWNLSGCWSSTGMRPQRTAVGYSL